MVFALTALAALTGTASAADLAARPYTKAPVLVAVVPSWTGCYVGGGGGYGLWNQENTGYDDTVACRGVARGRPPSPQRSTAVAATSARFRRGCDYQFALGTWNMVVGAFGDYDFASEKGTPRTCRFRRCTVRRSWTRKWAVGGRIGWLVTPQLLTYFSGGYTEAHFNQVNFNV